jgi:hypothetical protein
MARRIQTNIQEIEALDTPGEINTIGSTIWMECSGVLRTEQWNWCKRISVWCSVAMNEWVVGLLMLHPAIGTIV